MGALKKTTRKDFPEAIRRRDYAVEERRAQISLFSELERLIDQRQVSDIAYWQVALCLILCGLPYEETEERSITRRARLADGSWLTVTFTATGERIEHNADGEPVLDSKTGKPKITLIPLPFGADRGPLHFLINKALLRAAELERQGLDIAAARFVAWERASDYLEEMHLAPGGKNRRDLRARLERIKYCAITVTRSGRGIDETVLTPVFSRTRLPRSLDLFRQKRAAQSVALPDRSRVLGVEFNTEFFDEVLRNHMPVPVELLRATMGRSQIQDYVLWLYWRAFAAQKDTLIPWPAVKEQLWQNDSNEARLYAVMRRAIGILRAVWPELRAEVNPKRFGENGRPALGLLIGPPRDGVYMFTGVESARKQVKIVPPDRSKKPRKS